MEKLKNPAEAEAFAANAQVQSILQKHGWEASAFFPKMTTVAMGFGLAKWNEELAKMPAEQRQMMEQLMAEQMAQFDVHPDDLALIEPKLAELTQLFESM